MLYTDPMTKNFMKSSMNILILLLLFPLTFFVAPSIFNIEYGLVYGRDFDFGMFGLGAFALLVPIVVIPLVTLLLYVLFRKLISEKFEYATLLLIYVLVLPVFLYPSVVNFLNDIFLYDTTEVPTSIDTTIQLLDRLQEPADTSPQSNGKQSNAPLKQTAGIVVSGPRVLAVGEAGMWEIVEQEAAYFAVIWADGTPGRINGESGIPENSEFTKNSRFTHTFVKSGTYY